MISNKPINQFCLLLCLRALRFLFADRQCFEFTFSNKIVFCWKNNYNTNTNNKFCENLDAKCIESAFYTGEDCEDRRAIVNPVIAVTSSRQSYLHRIVNKLEKRRSCFTSGQCTGVQPRPSFAWVLPSPVILM